jgi:hypothetical protein
MTRDLPLSAADARDAIASALLRIVPDADLTLLSDQAPIRAELELDSLDFLSFVELLNGATGVRIDEADYPQLVSMSSSIAFLTRRGSDDRVHPPA